jgi:hypothetical protein
MYHLYIIGHSRGPAESRQQREVGGHDPSERERFVVHEAQTAEMWHGNQGTMECECCVSVKSCREISFMIQVTCMLKEGKKEKIVFKW